MSDFIEVQLPDHYDCDGPDCNLSIPGNEAWEAGWIHLTQKLDDAADANFCSRDCMNAWYEARKTP